MLRALRHLPIKQKLVALTMTISGAALLLACAAFALYEQAAYRRTLARDFAILADMFDENVAAGLEFKDAATIEQTLQSLSANEHIFAACVYDPQGVVIGAYRRAGSALGTKLKFPPARPTSQDFAPDRLDTFQDITLAGETIGVVYIGADLSELRERAWRYVVIIAILLAGCLLVAWGLASWLQRIVSQPIEDLAQTVATVAAGKDYTVRARKQGDDELGRLVDGFNEMLAQIQERDADLKQAGEKLEERVAERTRELAREQERFKFIFDFAPVGFTWMNPGHPASRMVNPSHCLITGVPMERCQELELYRLATHPDDRARQDRLHQRLQAGEIDHYDIEKRYVHADGSIRWVVLSVHLHPGANGDGAQEINTLVDITDRKQAEDALQRQQTELRVLIDLVPAMIVFKDRENIYRRVNQRFAISAGKTVEELEGKSSWEIFPAEAPRFNAEDAEVVYAGVPKLGIVELTHDPQGRELWVQTDKVPVADRDGQVVGLVIMAQDITARIRTEESLRLLGSAVEQTKESIMITDAELNLPGPKIIFVNSAFTKMTGYTAAEVLGRDPRLLQGPRTDRAVLDRLRHNLERGEEFTGEAVNYRKDRTTYDQEWQIAPLHNAAGTVTNFVAIQRDVTARKQAERELRASEERYRSLIENATDTIFTIGADGTFTSLNRAVETIAGLARTDWIGQPFVGMVHPDDLPVARDMFHRVMAGLPAPVHELRSHPSLPWAAVMEMTLSAQQNAVGKIIGVLGIGRDITARKAAEAALEVANKERVELSRLAGMAEIATGVLHNVGNVLNSVNVSATLIADQVRQTEAGKVAKLAALVHQHAADLAAFLTTDPRGRLIPDYLGTLAAALATEHQATLGELDQLRKNIDHIKEIVAVQQTYARASGVIEPVVLAELVDDTLRMKSGSFTQHGIKAIRDYQARTTVSTDKHRVMQILVNLMRNAKYACDDSGRTDKQITLRTRSDAHRFTIAVSDNGVGIPAENLTRIFNHGFTTRKEGHGFGLHSGALAARELGGSLTVQSAGPGLGATFTLELPCEPELPAHDNPAH